MFFDKALLLRVSEKIKNHGAVVGDEKRLDEFFLLGIYATFSEKGYQTCISDLNNRIQLNDNGELECKISGYSEKNRFVRKIKKIDKTFV